MPGNTPVSFSGAAMVSPRSMLLRVVRIASSMIALPEVLAVMSRPSRIGTPDAISVESVRQKRATAIFLRIGPRIGILSVIKMPILGPILRKIAVARFCRTLSTLMASGVPILDGLDITAKTSGNAIIEDAILTTRKSIERGETIAAPLKETGVFPGMVVQMIGVGEATGALDTMLSKIADFYEEEVDVAVEGLLTLLEPVMIAFLGGAVGGIVIAMYMPIFDLISKLT